MTVTAANFGSTSSVEILDLEDSDQYFFQFVDYFAQRGYTRDVNIRAAPYDYRLGASKLPRIMVSLTPPPPTNNCYFIFFRATQRENVFHKIASTS